MINSPAFSLNRRLAWSRKSPLRFGFNLLSSEKGLRHSVFTREGGTSEPPFESLNVSFAVGDEPQRVAANIEIIRVAMEAGRVVAARQNHGVEVVFFTGKEMWPQGKEPFADVIMTGVRGVALLVKLADCQGVILFDPDGALAVVHCGWRGNVSNVVGHAVSEMEKRLGSNPSEIKAAISPSLGPCCAEFVDYRNMFPDHFKRFLVKEANFDLWALSRRQLMDAGLKKENIECAEICTRCRTDLFFSYRGEGRTGRFCAAAMLV
ncbi:MAG: laccase domain-containing protein [Desulfobacteraceae bacterium]|jgi:YfiH family protein|nr:MAG: laccase domain-containing protein [Desulfobacteraceae bacterium]